MDMWPATESKQLATAAASKKRKETEEAHKTQFVNLVSNF